MAEATMEEPTTDRHATSARSITRAASVALVRRGLRSALRSASRPTGVEPAQEHHAQTPHDHPGQQRPTTTKPTRLSTTPDRAARPLRMSLMAREEGLFEVPPATVELRPVQRPRAPVLPAAFSSAGLRRIARRADGWLPVTMPLDTLMNLWGIVAREARDIGRDPTALRMALRVNLQLTDAPAMRREVPFRGTFQRYVDYARSTAAAGVDELFPDPGQASLSLSERIDIAGRFLEGVLRG